MDNTSELHLLAETLSGLRDEKEKLAAREKEINSEIELVQVKLVPLMKSLDMKNFNMAGKCFYLSLNQFAKVTDAPKAFAFFREQGCGDIIKETIHATTLSSTYKQLAEAGKIDQFSAEANGLSVHTKEEVRVRGGK